MTDNELTYQIRGAIWDVYNDLGPGLFRVCYKHLGFLVNFGEYDMKEGIHRIIL